MNGDENTNAPPSLLCCDRGGLVVPKLCLLPYIRLVIGKVMQYATSEGIKEHGCHVLKVNDYSNGTIVVWCSQIFVKIL